MMQTKEDGSIVLTVTRVDPTARLGLTITCVGMTDGYISGCCFDTSSKDFPDFQQQIRTGIFLHSVDGQRINWGPPTVFAEVFALIGSKTSFELRFIPSRSTTPSAVISVTAIPRSTTPLHVSRPELFQEGATPTFKTETSPSDGTTHYIAKTPGDGGVLIVDKRVNAATDGKCPMSQEMFKYNKEESCYGRFPLVSALVLKRMTREYTRVVNFKSERFEDVYKACILCSKEPAQHGRDGSDPPKPEDAYTPKSHMSCLYKQGMFEKYTRYVPPTAVFCPTRHPNTNELLCVVCKYPIAAHEPGADPADALSYLSPQSILATYTMHKTGEKVNSVTDPSNAVKKQPPPGWLPEHGTDLTITARTVEASPNFDPSKGPHIVKKVALVELSGWLEKYSTGRGIFNNWKRRFFVLKGMQLRYFDGQGQQATTAKGDIALTCITQLFPTPTIRDHPEAAYPDQDFLIIFTQDFGRQQFKLLMRAPSAGEKEKWVAALKY